VVILTLSAVALFFYRRSRHSSNIARNLTPTDTIVRPFNPELPVSFITAPRGTVFASELPNETDGHTRIARAELDGAGTAQKYWG
jgi:hypothetical protein